eukprot:2284799-Prymnesium_polylepis.1
MLRPPDQFSQQHARRARSRLPPFQCSSLDCALHRGVRFRDEVGRQPGAPGSVVDGLPRAPPEITQPPHAGRCSARVVRPTPRDRSPRRRSRRPRRTSRSSRRLPSLPCTLRSAASSSSFSTCASCRFLRRAGRGMGG